MLLTAATGGASLLSALLSPLCFLYIIVGGYQLYTENTLPPVALTLERLASVPALLCNWLVVLAGNFAGGLLGATVLAYTGVLSDGGPRRGGRVPRGVGHRERPLGRPLRDRGIERRGCGHRPRCQRPQQVLLGATEQGVLARFLTDTLHLSVVNEVDCSVVVSERPGHRNVIERLFAPG